MRRYLSVHEITEEGKSTTDAKSKDKGGEEIKQDIGLIRLAGLAVELSTAILALDVREHRWTQRASPPCVFDLLGIRASTVGTGFVLCCRLHISSR